MQGQGKFKPASIETMRDRNVVPKEIGISQWKENQMKPQYKQLLHKAAHKLKYQAGLLAHDEKQETNNPRKTEKMLEEPTKGQ